MAMDAERRQAELIAQFSSQAVALSSAQQLAALVLEATSHPALFAFSELLALPALSMLAGTQYSSSLDLLRLFAYGTLKDYKNNSGSLPALLPDQVRKLKQLSVLTLAESTKILPYDQLMQELDVSNGIVRGKLDQLRRCFEVRCLQPVSAASLSICPMIFLYAYCIRFRYNLQLEEILHLIS
uniref:COP9 signalosome complex subunit 7 n=1 Tax=Zea mays TaxID=4577 RepID=A0A804QEX0_MAIZE